VITPADAKRIAEEHQQPRMRKLVDRIDRALISAASDHDWPARTHIPSEERPVVDVVLRDYKRHGWKIVVVNDQRDGDYIQIEKP
jgi:hypothetical protein